MFEKIKNLVLDFAVLAMIAGFFIAMPSFSVASEAANVYGEMQMMRKGSAQSAVILQVMHKEVEADKKTRAAAAGLGGAVGGLLSSRAGNASYKKAALGAVLGGLLAERITNSVGKTEVQELIVKLKANDQIVVLVQPAPFDNVAAGDHVLVTEIANRVRIIPDYTSN